MKKTFFAFAFILLVLSTTSLFAQFQGTVHIKETTYSSDSKPTIKYSKIAFLESSVRVDETSEDSDLPDVLIVKSKEKKILLIMHEDKTYIEVDFQIWINIFKGLKDLMDDDDDEESYDDFKTNIRKTGRSTTLHGYKCQEYVYNDDESISTAWICENFADFWKMFKEITDAFDTDYSNSKNWFISAIGTNGFPFKLIEKGEDGELLSEWEVVKVDKSKPSRSLFEAPKGYKEMNLMDLFKQ
jgi:hypothetical protein